MKKKKKIYFPLSSGLGETSVSRPITLNSLGCPLKASAGQGTQHPGNECGVVPCLPPNDLETSYPEKQVSHSVEVCTGKDSPVPPWHCTPPLGT